MTTALDVATTHGALERAARTRHGITFVDRDLRERPLSYAELLEGADRIAAGLRRRGVEPGDRVCLLGPTTPELVVALFGTWRASAVPVVLPLPRRRSELDAFFADVTARIDHVRARVLGVADDLATFAPAGQHAVPLSELTAPAGDPAPEPDHDDLAYIQFTSGTTATSRAVALTHRNLLSNMRAAGEVAGIDAQRDVLVSWLPLFHDMGLIGLLFGSILFGARLVLEPTEEFLARPGSWLDAISRFGGTVTASPNFGYGLAARDMRTNPRKLDLSRWRVAANGAEPIDTDTLRGFADAAVPHGFSPEAMAPMYGLAEATLAVTMSSSDTPLHTEWVDRDALELTGHISWTEPGAPGARPFVSCGHPIPGTQVAIRDEHGEALPAGQVGEITVYGPSVTPGYWRDPDATDAILADGWLRTGDLGFWGADGLVVCGRLKDVIILGGRNLYPEDYEAATERVPGVRKGNVIAFAIPERERMVVVAETKVESPQAEEIARDALETLRRELQRGPEEIVLVAAGTLPKTSSGKKQRTACRDRYRSGDLEAVAVLRGR